MQTNVRRLAYKLKFLDAPSNMKYLTSFDKKLKGNKCFLHLKRHVKASCNQANFLLAKPLGKSKALSKNKSFVWTVAPNKIDT